MRDWKRINEEWMSQRKYENEREYVWVWVNLREKSRENEFYLTYYVNKVSNCDEYKLFFTSGRFFI